MKSKRWALVVLVLIAFGAAFFISGKTVVWFLSPEFEKEIDCWLDRNNGTWLTPNESHMIGMTIMGVVSLIASCVVWTFLNEINAINNKTAGSILLLSMFLGALVIFANAATNEGYIDRLYEACERQR